MSWTATTKIPKDADVLDSLNSIEVFGNEGVVERDDQVTTAKDCAIAMTEALPAGEYGWQVNMGGHASQDHQHGYDAISVSVAQLRQG